MGGIIFNSPIVTTNVAKFLSQLLQVMERSTGGYKIVQMCDRRTTPSQIEKAPRDSNFFTAVAAPQMKRQTCTVCP